MRERIINKVDITAKSKDELEALLERTWYDEGYFDFRGVVREPAGEANLDQWRATHWGTTENADERVTTYRTETQISVEFVTMGEAPTPIFEALREQGYEVNDFSFDEAELFELDEEDEL